MLSLLVSIKRGRLVVNNYCFFVLYCYCEFYQTIVFSGLFYIHSTLEICQEKRCVGELSALVMFNLKIKYYIKFMIGKIAHDFVQSQDKAERKHKVSYFNKSHINILFRLLLFPHHPRIVLKSWSTN